MGFYGIILMENNFKGEITMKRVLSLIMVFLLALSMLAGCGAKAEELKFGLGVYATYGKTTDADGETNGTGSATVNTAAVLLDKDGKIVKCVIDCADNKASFTAEGKAVAATEFKTKYELGKDYNMVAYGGAKLEWYEQIDAFTKLIAGKTIDEVKALVADTNKGTDEVVTAGCTILIADYVKAVENAVANAAESKATKDATLKLGVVTSAKNEDATDEKEGSVELDTTVVASALDAEGKIIVAATDVAAATVKFDTKGKAAAAATAEITTKKTAGKDYGMGGNPYAPDLNKDGKVLEWDEQAAAFNAACVGLDKDGVAKLAIETGYGADALQTAGCTIHVGDMVKAAVKAATVA